MKKLFLMLAFTGIVGAATANTLVTFSKSTITFLGDDKKGDDKKKEGKSCSKDEKTGCKKGDGKSCCHAKAEGDATGSTKSTDAKTTTSATATPAKK